MDFREVYIGCSASFGNLGYAMHFTQGQSFEKDFSREETNEHMAAPHTLGIRACDAFSMGMNSGSIVDILSVFARNVSTASR